MKIYLNKEYLKSFTNDDSQTQLNNKVKQLKEELMSDTNSNFLISGYRGVGKSTFINKLKKSLEKESKDNSPKYFLININLGSYSNYTSLLRKIVRSIYTELISISEDKKKIISNSFEKNNLSLVNELKLFYEKTFYDIKNNKISLNRREKSVSYQWSGDIKTIIFAFSPFVITIASLFSGILKMINQNPVIFMVASSIWPIIAIFIIKYKYNSNKTENEELIRDSLYDDDITEYKLLEILRQFKNEKMIITFAFDEIDKMNEQQVSLFLNEIKPFMMSGFSNFIFVTGQKVYYEYEFSQTLDDAVITSLFSRTIHIDLADRNSFIDIFNKIVDYNRTTVLRENINNYLNHKILTSNKILRKFINSIRQDIEYNDNMEAFINLEKYEIKQLENDTAILEIIDTIINESINIEKISNGLKDFLKMQLFLAIKKAQMSSLQEFQSIDIIDLEYYKQDKNLMNLVFKSKILIEELLEQLVLEGFLKKEEKFDDEGLSLVFYRWLKHKNINSEEVKKAERISVEEDVNLILKLLLQNKDYENIKNKDLVTKIKNLEELKIVDSEKYHKLIENYLNFSSDTSENNLERNINDLLKSHSTYLRFSNELYENFVYENIQAVINNNFSVYKEYRGLKNINIPFDIVLQNNSNKKSIFFEIKFIKNINSIKAHLRNIQKRFQNVIEELENSKTVISFELLIFGEFDATELSTTKMYINQNYSYKNVNIQIINLENKELFHSYIKETIKSLE